MNAGEPLEESYRVILCVCLFPKVQPPFTTLHSFYHLQFLFLVMCFPSCVLHSMLTLIIDIGWGEERVSI